MSHSINSRASNASRASRTSRASQRSALSVLSAQARQLDFDPLPVSQSLSASKGGGNGPDGDDSKSKTLDSSNSKGNVIDLSSGSPGVAKPRKPSPPPQAPSPKYGLESVTVCQPVAKPRVGKSLIAIPNQKTANQMCGAKCGVNASGSLFCGKLKSECSIKEHKIRERHENCREGLFRLRKTSSRIVEVYAVPLIGGPNAVKIFDNNFGEWSSIEQSNPTFWNAKLRKELSPKKKEIKNTPSSKRKPPKDVPPKYLSHTKKHEGFSIFAPPPDTPSPVEGSSSDDDSAFHDGSIRSDESPVYEADADGIPRIVGVTKKSDLKEELKVVSGRKKGKTMVNLKVNLPGNSPAALKEASAILHLNAIDLDEQTESALEVFKKSAELCEVKFPRPYQLPELSGAAYQASIKIVEAVNIAWQSLSQNAATLLKVSNELKKMDTRTYNIYKHLTRYDENGVPKKLMPGNVWASIDELGELTQVNVKSIQDLYLKSQKLRLTADEDRRNGEKIEKEATEALKEMVKAHDSLREFEKAFNGRLALLEAAQKSTASLVTSSAQSPKVNEDVAALGKTVATTLKTNEILVRKIEMLEGRITQISNNAQTTVSNQAQEKDTELLKTIEAMGRKVDMSNRRIMVLEEATDRTTVSYIIGSDTVRSPSDVEMVLEKSNAIVDFGLSMGILEMLNAIYLQGLGRSDSIKQRKLVQELGMSDFEGKALANSDQIFPALFCSSKTDLATTFGEISVEDWRSKDETRSGVAFDLEARLEKYLVTLESAINSHYDSGSTQDLIWANISKTIVRDSGHFISLLIRYIDSMLDFLTVSGGHEEEAAWRIIMKATRRIFEEHFSVARGVPVGVLPEASSDAAVKRRFRARMVWNALHAHKLVKEMNASRIRRHALIEGAYSEWVLTHSGRSEAVSALSTTDRMSADLKKLQSTITALEKSVSEAATMAKGAKSAADRAASRQNAGSGKEKK